ncbi:EAL domain-containing protein [Thiomicrorhabdus sp. Kp2]|uniref:bifunctional diguanylate cyclase/phosphodiesterase n=1 Tax=Thiomicrorhabdus sp. Kp2 TaxID=1123518 RepID=UPI0003F4AD8E|nr:EAL domain-containing protein [Thiomicrorhabdus sp. Kp2]
MTSVPSAQFFKHFLRYFLPSMGLVLVLAYVGMQQAQKEPLSSLNAKANEKVLMATTAAIENLDLIVRDIFYITNSELLSEVLNSDVSLDKLARDWQALMANSPIYDQLRWIDAKGHERLRIDRSEAFPVRIPEDELQNKSNRYYFSNAMKLKENQFYLSPFDLNVEYGIIDEPRKPMIRLAKPVFDQQGVKRGVIVLNYLGNDMLQHLKKLKDKNSQKIWLTNAQGYWLLGCTPQNEWGFMYDKPELTVKHRYPDAWQKIISQEKGSFSDESGLWHFDTIRPLQQVEYLNLADQEQIVVDDVNSKKVVLNSHSYNPYFWKVVYFSPMQEIMALKRSVLMPFYVGLSVILILVLIGSIFLARSRLAKEAALRALKASNKKLDKTSKQLTLDIVAKERAKKELEESVERYSSVLNASMDGFVLMNQQGFVLECNLALYEILHIENKNIDGVFLGTLFDKEQEQKITQYISDIFERGYCKVELARLVDNAKFHIEISLMPVCATQQICAFIRDVTSQKENEFQLEMAASVFTHANEGIILTDANFLIVDINDEFEFITGNQREDVIGKIPSMMNSNMQSSEYYADIKHALLRKGHWYGEVWSRRKTGEPILVFLNITKVKNPHGGACHYVWMFNDITLEKQYQKRLQNSAHYDMLTNLPNRFLLNDRIQQAIKEAKRNQKSLAIVFIDLDGFKTINDTFGHDAGDQLLVNASTEMKAALRATDTIARIGGDEFVAVIGGLHDSDEALPIIEKLLAAISIPVKKGNQSLQVSGSLGVTFFPQETSLDGEQLIRQADQAMYQAKQSGKNGYHVFDTERDAYNRDLIRSLNSVEQGLLNNEFVLHYQPKVSLRNDEVVGVEALIRWQHPEKGLLYPAEFLPSVENTPLSIKMSEWVINQALQQIDTWLKQGIKLSVSVNVGVMELQKGDFVEWISELLNQHPSVPRSMLEFEVLETSALEDVVSVKALIEECKKCGIAFALDDFGTGFASLSYLKRLPIKTIKIDQSFIRNMFEDPEDITLLEGLIGLTKSLNRKVIAEGIESEKHGSMLIELGCNYGQGYFIAKPMEPKFIAKWLASWHRPESWITQVSFAEKARA